MYRNDEDINFYRIIPGRRTRPYGEYYKRKTREEMDLDDILDMYEAKDVTEIVRKFDRGQLK